jgi:hypothetical protein
VSDAGHLVPGDPREARSHSEPAAAVVTCQQEHGITAFVSIDDFNGTATIATRLWHWLECSSLGALYHTVKHDSLRVQARAAPDTAGGQSYVAVVTHGVVVRDRIQPAEAPRHDR